MTYRYLLCAALVTTPLGAGCVDQPGAIVCPTGIVCPDGTTCAAAQPVCIVNPCGNGRVDTGETCDDGNILSGDGCSPTCGNEACGNGLQEPGERCDDNNTANGDGCSADCLSLEECGNGIKDVKSGGATAEGCDDGNTVNGDGCRGDCKSAEFCGNSLVDVNEVCDDGMAIGGPCSPDCQSGLGCGNGFLDPGEQCDDGNTVDGDDCRFPSCKHAVCGDGIENTLGVRFEECDGGTTGTPTETVDCNIDCTDSECGDGKVNQTDDEECDNGTTNDSSSCDNDCTIPVCGDSHINTTTTPVAEVCDPGTVGGSTSTCDSNCSPPSCGDGFVNKSFTPPGGTAPEGCDDSNTTSGDGCSALCQIESCGNGVVEMVNGEECDDGDTDDLDDCRNNCQDTRCGDGVHSTGATMPVEVCDTGGNSGTCDSDCTAPVCNDGIMNAAANEQCEDGNTTNGDGCSSTCRLEPFALAVTRVGSAASTGLVTSAPAGINCGTDCAEIYLANTAVTLTAMPALNATFNGFSGSCTGATCNLTMSSSRNVTATFELNTLTIAKTGTGTGTVSGGGINCGATCSVTLNVGTSVMLTAAPNSDSIFTGWSGGGCGATSPCMTTISQAQTITANFTLNTFAFNLTKGGVGTGTITSSPAGISCGAACPSATANFTANTLVTLVPAPSADSTFTGFSGDCTGTTCAVPMTAVKNVTANFALKPVTLTVSSSSGGDVDSTNIAGIDCGNDCTQDYPIGTVVHLTPDSDANRAFTGWSGACTGTTVPCVVTMDAAKTVGATFETNRLTVTRLGAGNGTVTGTGISCGNNCTEDFDEGDMVLLTAAATGTGSIFTGWDGGPCTGVTTPTCTVTMTGPITISATFEPASTLTVTSPTNGTVTGTGINCPGDCTEKLQTGSGISVTANPDTGFQFVSWTGCTSTSGATCSVTLSSNTTVTATFAPI
jgi:cysteine-rich repeat protein